MTRFLLFLFLSGCFSLQLAQTGKIRALIIGNDKYTAFPPLNQAPIKDADEMRNALIAVGLDPGDVTVGKDLTFAEFTTKLVEFRNRLQPDDSALFYFSGHGFSIDGADFLAPVNFAFGDSKEAAKQNSISLAQILAILANPKNRVIILDACRTDAPLLKQMATGSSLGQFLALQGTGSLVAYATGTGKASSARSSSGLSFYTQYLVNSLYARPKDIKTALDNAKTETIVASRNDQIPAVYDEMAGTVAFVSGGGAVIPSVPAQPGSPSITKLLTNLESQADRERLTSEIESAIKHAYAGSLDEYRTNDSDNSSVLVFSGAKACHFDPSGPRRRASLTCYFSGSHKMYLDLVKLLRSTVSVKSLLPGKWDWGKFGSGEGVSADLSPGKGRTEYGGGVSVDYLVAGRVGIILYEGDIP